MFWSLHTENSAVNSHSVFIFLQKKVSSNNACVKAVLQQMPSSEKPKFCAHTAVGLEPELSGSPRGFIHY